MVSNDIKLFLNPKPRAVDYSTIYKLIEQYFKKKEAKNKENWYVGTLMSSGNKCIYNFFKQVLESFPVLIVNCDFADGT